jgi:hypothetical protein
MPRWDFDVAFRLLPCHSASGGRMPVSDRILHCAVHALTLHNRSGYDTAFKWSTAAACCPKGYSHDGRTTGQTDCSSAFPTNMYTALACKAGVGISTTSARVSGYTPDVFASPVIIRFTATPAKPITLPSSTRLTPAPTRSPGSGLSKKSRVSKAALAGIVLGALIALGLIIGAVLFLLHRRKQKQKILPAASSYQQDYSLAPDTTYYGHKAELAAASPTTDAMRLSKMSIASPMPAVGLTGGQAMPQNGHHSWAAPADQQHQYGAQAYVHGQQGYAPDPRATSPFANPRYAGAPEGQSLLQHQPYGGPEPGRPTRPAELG